MKRNKYLIYVVIVLLLVGYNSKIRGSMTMDKESEILEIQSESQGIEGDPLNVRIHRLSNGLTLYMSVNRSEPRIATNIAVRAGSKQDPANSTGLAHYLEHMMFKGTRNIGALDWEKEKPLLDKIAELYEKHRETKDLSEREKIYAKIDSISNQAAKYVAANEYDKMVSALGAKGTNAYTWVEQTVYVNDIPSNELEKWMQLESERFKEVVLRFFHTELEAVYEEYNINQDRDFRKTMKAITESLFPTHPYGTQTTIGKGEHLKSPSHYDIYHYFSKYYVPNNMAIMLAGDFDPEAVIQLAEEYFESYKAQELNPWTYEEQEELANRVQVDVYGQESPYIDLAWKVAGANTDDALIAQLIKGILYNRQAGIIDLEINKKQRLLEADAFIWNYADYGVIGLSGKPKEGQSLEQVEDSLMQSMRRLRDGQFDDWLIDAVIRNMKLDEIRAQKSNNARVYKMTSAFILGTDWEDVVKKYDRMSEISKEDIQAFAKKYLRDNNYVAVYKYSGEDKNVEEVEKPEITPVELIRDKNSQWMQDWEKTSSPPLSPVFLDFDNDMETSMDYHPAIEINRIHNDDGLFSLLYVYDMGKNADQKLTLAMKYLPYLGTSAYSSEQFQKELYRLGLEFNTYTQNEKIYMILSGLEESFDLGIQLINQLFEDANANKEALENLKKDILTKRENKKQDKRTILRSALYDYAKYGKKAPFSNVLNNQELQSVSSDELLEYIHALNEYEHNIFFYGKQSMRELIHALRKSRSVREKLKPAIDNQQFSEQNTDGKKVYFVNFPMVQAEILLLSKGTEHFSLEEYLSSELYNTYFGFGLSSIVFQEIRESRALAYSAYAYNGKPSKKDRAHYLTAYVGTQADKMPQAVNAIKEILQEMPLVKEQVESARKSILKKIETDRITESSIYWTYVQNKELGFERDLRKDVYDYVKDATAEDLLAFHKKTIKDRKYDILVMADREEVDMEYLSEQGELIELSLEEIFGY